MGPVIEAGGRRLVNFASNDYLGLAAHPALVDAAIEATRRFGAGAGASRLLGGGCTAHAEFETRAASFKGAESALLFNSGYAANTGAIPALAREGWVILSDELNHASLIDGCRMSRAEVRVYRHADAAHARALLGSHPGPAMIVTDTVFSMDGDVAPLPALDALARERGAILYMDDAHGTGVLGEGYGALAGLGMEPEPHMIQMSTCSKALGSVGAFVAGTSEVVRILRSTARAFMFSTALPASAPAASLAALDLIKRGEAGVARLMETRQILGDALAGVGISTAQSETPIVPVMMGRVDDAMRVAGELMDAGYYAPAIRPPTVREPRIRLTVTALHTPEQIAGLAEALAAALKR
jgi:8-amino-7-oxononanoate synthase